MFTSSEWAEVPLIILAFHTLLLNESGKPSLYWFQLCDVQDNTQKRSPHLVPYSEVNATIKKMNRESATDVVKTLLAYGYVIEPVSGESEQSTSAASSLSPSCLLPTTVLYWHATVKCYE